MATEWPEISVEVANAIAQHARDAYPEEAIGILASSGGKIVRVYVLRNVATDPRGAHVASIEDHLEAERLMRDRGEELAAIFHSHPGGSSQPSAIDVKLAALRPGVAHLIFSVRERRLGAFRVNAAGELEVAVGEDDQPRPEEEPNARSAR